MEAGDVQAKIEAAFQRSAEIDARRVHVTAMAGTIILSGYVRSFAERQEAERGLGGTRGLAGRRPHYVP